MTIVYHHANGRFDWLISGQQSVNPSRDAISILSGIYKGVTFIHPVAQSTIAKKYLNNIFKLKNNYSEFESWGTFPFKEFKQSGYGTLVMSRSF